MTERICEHCGQQFLSETIRDKLENIGYPALTIFGPISAVDCFRGHAFLRGSLWLALVGSGIYEMVKRHRKKVGRVVKFGLACPSCGDRTAHVDSPLGEQLIEHWSSPHTEDLQDIFEQPSTISGEGEEVDAVVSHSGSACE
jgi:hypothetical protein